MSSSKLTCLFATLLLLSACQTRISETDWPKEVPSRDFFVNSGTQIIGADTSGFNRKLSAYLTWVKRFYLGSFIYPLGWNEMSENVLNSMNSTQDKADVEKRMYNLGKLICAEWAQEGNQRKINSANVAAWGNALRKAVKSEEQIEFITKVEQDVADLLAGRLQSDDVNLERYYTPPVYDDF